MQLCFSLMWKGWITTVSVWREQEQLRGRPVLSASCALSVSLQREKKKTVSVLLIRCWNMCVFNIFSAEIEKTNKHRHKAADISTDDVSLACRVHLWQLLLAPFFIKHVLNGLNWRFVMRLCLATTPTARWLRAVFCCCYYSKEVQQSISFSFSHFCNGL